MLDGGPDGVEMGMGIPVRKSLANCPGVTEGSVRRLVSAQRRFASQGNCLLHGGFGDVWLQSVGRDDVYLGVDQLADLRFEATQHEEAWRLGEVQPTSRRRGRDDHYRTLGYGGRG